MNKIQNPNLIMEQIFLDDQRIPSEEKRRHIERYEFVYKYLKPNWTVLDAACGTGYGTKILSKKAKEIVGIDISQKAINYAQRHYTSNNIKYLLADLTQKIPFPDEHFDAVISLETLEHIKNQEFLLMEFQRILKKNGILIISTPDKNVTKTVGIKTPYHVRELTKEEFYSLLKKFFEVEELYGQTRYKFLSKSKRFLRWILLKLDILKFRKLIIRGNLKKVLKKEFSSFIYTPIEKIEIDMPSEHWVLIAIAKKIL